MRARVLADLRGGERIVTTQEARRVALRRMDPAYVHITKASLAEVRATAAHPSGGGVYPVGRYGGWTYCSIEDNIVETRALAHVLGEVL
jgi:hypothetical protein